MSWKLIARDKLAGAAISQSVETNSDGWLYRYTATIRGYQGFLIAEGCIGKGEFTYQDVIDRVVIIRDRIDAGDEKVFYENHLIFPNAYRPDTDYWWQADTNVYPTDTAVYTAGSDPFAVTDPVESYFEDGALYLNLEAELDVTERARFARGLLLHNNHLKTCEWQIGLHTGTSFAITFRHVLALDEDRAQIKAFALDFLGNLKTTRAIPPAVQPSLF